MWPLLEGLRDSVREERSSQAAWIRYAVMIPWHFRDRPPIVPDYGLTRICHVDKSLWRCLAGSPPAVPFQWSAQQADDEHSSPTRRGAVPLPVRSSPAAATKAPRELDTPRPGCLWPGHFAITQGTPLRSLRFFLCNFDKTKPVMALVRSFVLNSTSFVAL